MEERSFEPCLAGGIVQDVTLARMLNRLRGESLGLLGDLLSFCVCFEKDAEAVELFDRLARGELEQLRLLGRLVVALGGEGAPKLQIRTRGGSIASETPRQVLSALYQTLERLRLLCKALGRFAERCDGAVARAALFYLLEQRKQSIEELSALVG